MTRYPPLRIQRGVTLIVGLIMLVVITLMVTSAFLLSTTNLKAVANVQFRDEAIAASNLAVEDVLSSLLPAGSTVRPPQQTIQVDLNNDANTDYTVQVIDPEHPTDTSRGPVCIRATVVPVASAAGTGSSVSLSLEPPNPDYNTVWDIFATVTDAASGASVTIRQGVRVLLTQAQKDAVCH